MKFFVLIALGIAFNASFLSSFSYAAGPRNNNARLCAELLTSFQDKMSRGLRKELHSARGNKKLTVFLLIPQDVAENNSAYSPQSTNIPLRGRLQQFGIELVKSHEPVNGRIYLEVRGTKKSLLILMDDFRTRANTLGVSELEWAGLGKRTIQVASEPTNDRATTYPQASTELREVLNSSQVKDSKVVEAAFYISYDGVENVPSRREKLDIVSARVQNVAAILKGLEAKGLVIKNKFEGLGMILVEAPTGLLRETLSQEIKDVREVTPFDSNQRIELIRPVDVRPVETPAQPLGFETVKSVQERFLKSEYCNFAGFRGLGIGKNDAGAFVLRMNVATEADLAGKPSSFEGVEVQYRVVGEIVALGAGSKQTQPLNVEMLKKYKAELKPKLQNIPGYTGIGIGDVNGGMGIRIYVKTEADIKNFEEVVKNLPVPVGFQVTGEIHAFGALAEPKQSMMFQLQLAKDGINLEQAKAILREAGIEIDESYPAVDIGSDGKLVLRGQATESAMKKAQEKLKGVQFFADVQFAPFGGPAGGIGTFGPPQSNTTWQPSSHVRKLFERENDLNSLLNKKADDVVHVEFAFHQDMRRQSAAASITPDHPRYKWWQEWLKQQYASQPEAITSYTEAIPYLEALYGQELQFLVSRGVEILKPETHSILFGTFGVRGRFQSVAETLDTYPRTLAVPTSWRPTQYPMGALPPQPTGGLAPISISNVPHEVLLALANPDRNANVTISLIFESKADFDVFQEQLKVAGNGIVDKFILDDQTPYLATIKGKPDALNDLLSRLTESKPGAITVELPAERRLIAPVKPGRLSGNAESGTAEKTTYNIVVSRDYLARIDEVVERLRGMGVEVSNVMRRIGAITVKFDPAKLDEVKSVLGVDVVEPNRRVHAISNPSTDKTTYNIVVSDEYHARIGEVVEHLRSMGVEVTNVMETIGAITVKFDPAKLNEVKAVLGVDVVEPNREVRAISTGKPAVGVPPAPGIRDQVAAEAWEKLFHQFNDPTNLSAGLQQTLASAQSPTEVDIFVMHGWYYKEFVDALKAWEGQGKLKLKSYEENYSSNKGIIVIEGTPEAIREAVAWKPVFRGAPMKVVQFADVPNGEFSRVLRKIDPLIRGKFMEMTDKDSLNVILRVDGDKATFDRVVAGVSRLGVTVTSQDHISNYPGQHPHQSGQVYVNIKRVLLYQIVNLMPEIEWVDYQRGFGALPPRR